VAEDDEEPDLEIVPCDAGAATLRRRFLVRQAPEQERRSDIADCIAQDRDRRAQRLNQQAADGRADDLRRRRCRFLLGVGIQQPAFLDQSRHIGLVRRIEDERAGGHQEYDDEQMHQRKRTRPGRERNGRQQPGAHQVGRDQEWSPPHAIDQDAGRQAEQQIRQRDREIEPGQIERPRAQQDHRAELNRLPPDPRAEGRRRLRTPQMQEAAMAPEGGHCSKRNKSLPPPSWGRVGVGVVLSTEG
jgi:hypothetical protein